MNFNIGDNVISTSALQSFFNQNDNKKILISDYQRSVKSANSTIFSIASTCKVSDSEINKQNESYCQNVFYQNGKSFSTKNFSKQYFALNVKDHESIISYLKLYTDSLIKNDINNRARKKQRLLNKIEKLEKYIQSIKQQLNGLTYEPSNFYQSRLDKIISLNNLK